MTTGERMLRQENRIDMRRFTTCELAWSVAAGDAAAIPPLLRHLHAPVIAYCRARAQGVGVRRATDSETFAEADRLALEVCRTILAELAAPSGADRPFLRMAYSIAADAADTRFRARSGGSLTRVQREVLILRTLVGLDARQTSVAMGIGVERVTVAQHAALTSLRAA